MATDENIQAILNDLTSQDINPTNIMSVTIDIMQYAQQMITTKKNGQQKKELVLLVLQQLIDQVEDESMKAHLNTLMTTCVPETIDMVVLVASGKVDLGKLSKKYLPCCFK